MFSFGRTSFYRMFSLQRVAAAQTRVAITEDWRRSFPKDSLTRISGQGAIGTNWSTGSSVWTWGRTSSLWGWRSTGTGCPGRLWSLPLWRYSRPAWTRSCAACCRWPCFSRGVGLDDPQRPLPTPNILWVCDCLACNKPQQITGLHSQSWCTYLFLWLVHFGKRKEKKNMKNPYV